MPIPLDALLGGFIVFVLVLTRVAALVMTAPALSSVAIPLQVRILLAVAVSVLIAPPLWNTPLEPPRNLLQLAALVGSEAMLGLALGLGVMALFGGLQLTGQVMGQMSGMQLADAFDPSFDASVPLFSQMLNLLMLAVFLLIGGHRALFAALLDTFQAMPPGAAVFQASITEAIVEIVAHSFLLGLRAVAPVMVSLLVSLLILGLISRTLPQLNVIVIGFSMNSMLMLAVFVVSIGGMVWVFHDAIEPTIDVLRASFLPPVEPPAPAGA